VTKIIKICINEYGYPEWFEGEVSEEELKRLIRLLQVMLENRRKFKKEEDKIIYEIENSKDIDIHFKEVWKC